MWCGIIVKMEKVSRGGVWKVKNGLVHNCTGCGRVRNGQVWRLGRSSRLNLLVGAVLTVGRVNIF